jgi:hypothetical protein
MLSLGEYLFSFSRTETKVIYSCLFRFVIRLTICFHLKLGINSITSIDTNLVLSGNLHYLRYIDVIYKLRAGVLSTPHPVYSHVQLLIIDIRRKQNKLQEDQLQDMKSTDVNNYKNLIHYYYSKNPELT